MKEASNEARRWFLQAKDDLKFVNWIRKERVFFDKGCFISQQAGEKILKACLYVTGKRFVLGHSLMEMLLELEKKDNIFRDIRNEAKRLRIPLNSATRSTDKRPPVPQESGRSFHAKMATQATCRSEATGMS
jgi:HEPN domain-containing protein